VRLGVVPESWWERVALRLGRVPTPIVETHAAFFQARAVMTAVELGVFEALAAGPRTAPEVASACGTDPEATGRLLRSLSAARYLQPEGEAFALAPTARRWVLANGHPSVRDKLLFQLDEWALAEGLSAYVRTGEPTRLHETLSPEAWGRYQRAMRALAVLSAPEVARRTPVPRGASALLDLGGAHGVYAAALCARYPDLRATVLDLPQAGGPARDPLGETPGAERVTFQDGDAREADLGEEAWDVVLMANLAHHLTEVENRALAARVARALRPGGVWVVQEWVRPATPREARRAGFGPLLDLYFALTSRSGTWSLAELRAWQGEAGLRPARSRWLWTLPGTAQQAAWKPR
jgi:SAM-dependent methyltransferase